VFRVLYLSCGFCICLMAFALMLRLLYLCRGFFIRSIYYIHEYILFTKLKMSWNEAQHHCRVKYGDLATISDERDISRINNMAKDWDRAFWIGLYDDVNSWKWSLVGERFYTGVGTDYRKWQEDQPDNAGAVEHCVSMMEDGLWRDNSCTLVKVPLICYRGEM
uniref:C-type lectin domain-containing protein n=1 Tax=Seriola lalandi dorsalis TaxID=1841481 RepID=A0A3B4X245_SERLL